MTLRWFDFLKDVDKMRGLTHFNTVTVQNRAFCEHYYIYTEIKL